MNRSARHRGACADHGGVASALALRRVRGSTSRNPCGRRNAATGEDSSRRGCAEAISSGRRGRDDATICDNASRQSEFRPTFHYRPWVSASTRGTAASTNELTDPYRQSAATRGEVIENMRSAALLGRARRAPLHRLTQRGTGGRDNSRSPRTTSCVFHVKHSHEVQGSSPIGPHARTRNRGGADTYFPRARCALIHICVRGRGTSASAIRVEHGPERSGCFT